MFRMNWNDFAHVVYNPSFRCWFYEWKGDGSQRDRVLSPTWREAYHAACKVAKAKGLKGIITYVPPEGVEL
jgi:hypothetical protein